MSKSKLRSACAIDCGVSGCGRRKSLKPIEASALQARGDERVVYGAATRFDGPWAGALEHNELELHELVIPSHGRAGVVQWQNISFPS